MQALAHRAAYVDPTAPPKRARTWIESWPGGLLLSLVVVVVTRVTSAQGREDLLQYWWALLALALWVVTYQVAERFGLWRLLRDGDPGPLERWQKVGLSGLCAWSVSSLLYQFLLQPNKEDWLQAAGLALTAAVFFSRPLQRKYGWIALGACLYLVFFVFQANLIKGAEWNFWRVLVFGIALFVAGLFGPVASGDPSVAVVIGSWAIAYGLWWIRNRLVGGAERAHT